jgi:enoyl-CoA hydratase/carnithine racemase
MSDQLVHFRTEGRVGSVVLDRPEAGNRINVATMRAFIDALTRANEADIDVLTISATGSDFSLGRDQDEKPTGLSKRDNLALILDANRLLGGFQGVTVAAINGRALGFGSGVAAQCDITIASDLAQLCFTEIQHGFAPSIVMTYLETYVNRKVALDLLMTGRIINAAEAQSMGIVTRVVPDEHLAASVQQTVDSLTDKPAHALRQCKFFLREIATVPEADRGPHALDALAPLT